MTIMLTVDVHQQRARTLHTGAAQPPHQHNSQQQQQQQQQQQHGDGESDHSAISQLAALPFADLLGSCFSAFPGDPHGVHLLLHLLALPGQQLGALRWVAARMYRGVALACSDDCGLLLRLRVVVVVCGKSVRECESTLLLLLLLRRRLLLLHGALVTTPSSLLLLWCVRKAGTTLGCGCAFGQDGGVRVWA